MALSNNADLLTLLPKVYYQILDFQELMKTETIELNNFAMWSNNQWLNLFIQTADDESLQFWEALFNLPNTGNIYDRRAAILLRMWRQLPFTLPRLKQMLNSELGEGKWILDMDYSNYVLTVSLENYDENDINVLRSILIQIVPAHIATIIKYSPMITSTQDMPVQYGSTDSSIYVGTTSQSV